MAVVVQSKFTVTLPTQDDAVPPNALVVGELTALDFEITVDGVMTVYSVALSDVAAVGSVQEVLFTALAPAFAPVAGKAYSADCFAVDAQGNGLKSATINWTQNAASGVPAAPTNFSVG